MHVQMSCSAVWKQIYLRLQHHSGSLVRRHLMADAAVWWQQNYPNTPNHYLYLTQLMFTHSIAHKHTHTHAYTHTQVYKNMQTHMLTDAHPKTSLKNPKQPGNKKVKGKNWLNSACIETSKGKGILLQQRKWAVKPIESLISIPNASDMVGRCCFWGLEWRAGSCHLSAVLCVKAGMAAQSRLVYNELDASQNVYSPNITHFRRPF